MNLMQFDAGWPHMVQFVPKASLAGINSKVFLRMFSQRQGWLIVSLPPHKTNYEDEFMFLMLPKTLLAS